MHNNCKKLCFFLEKVLEPYPPQHAAIYKSAISSLKMIEFLWQSICDFVYLYVVWSSVLFSLCMQPFQHHIARFLFFMYPMVGGDLRKAPFTLRGRGGWGKRSCRGRNLSPNPTPHLLPPSACHPPASSCRFPTPLSALTDPAWNRGPSPVALSDPLFTEGGVCLEPELGKWRAGVEGRIFSITTEIREIWTCTLKREVIWSPKKAIKQTRSVGIRDQNCEANRLSGLRQVTFNLRASFSLLQAGAVLELINFAGCLEIHDQRLEQGRRRFCVAVTLVPRKMKASSFFTTPQTPVPDNEKK